MLVLVGAERQDDAEVAVGVGQPLVGGQGAGRVGMPALDRGVGGEVVDAFDQLATLAQRIPEVGVLIGVAEAETVLARPVPYGVEVQRQANLHDVLDPILENERTGIAVAGIELAGLAVALLAENVDLGVVLGRGFLRRGLQRAGEIKELPADIGGHDQEIGRIVGDLHHAGENDLAFG